MVAAPDVLDAFHPLVSGWFRERFGAPTEPQRAGWPRISAGQDVLIAAPTGSGKTLAAFLACLDALVRRGLERPLPDHTAILYISPLKALSNDVHRNLEAPLAELMTRAAIEGIKFPEIRVAVRTGDTPISERAKMAKRPPHILVTTPESLFILLTTVSGRASLGQLSTVIVDEIHAVAGDKRGAHLALSLERLDRLVQQTTGRRPVRVGLSATQRPIERIARLLVGTHRPMPHIVDAGHRREIDLAIEITDDELGAVASNEQFGRVYDRIAELVMNHRSTIVFVNTRRLVERAAAALEQRLGEENVVAHHGSMSRTLRLAAEQKLKHGQVRCAVATASLELGIDVGTVDLVVQLGSPRSIATLLQRVGRSGHTLGGTPKGRLFALTRDQLIECAALVRGVRRGNLDAITIRDAPLDIVAQQIVAACAAEDISEVELGAMIRGATPYSELADDRLEQILSMLSEGVSDRRGRVGAYLHRDRIGGMLRGRRGARLAAVTSGGAIPDNANYTVVQFPEETQVGTVDEDFAIESSAGDIFQLGNTSWRIRRVEAGRVLVDDAKGQPPTIPFWVGEAPARTRELSDEVSALRGDIDRKLGDGDEHDSIAAWVVGETHMIMRAAQQLVAYLAAGRAALGALPRKDLLIAERFFDEAGGMQLVLHAPLGGRINRAWGLALRKKFCRTFDFELQASATDDGIVISLGQPHSFALDTVFAFVTSPQCKDVLVQALLDRPMFEIRWRWNVTRSLTVLRRRNGKKVPPHLVKMRAADTLSVVFPAAQMCVENVPGDREIPDHPLVFETIRDCLVEAMDAEGFRGLIEQLERGEIQVIARDTVEPSPLSHELINANPYAYLDDAPLEERRTRAVQLRRGLPASVASSDDVGALDPAAIMLATEEVAPTVRDLDELHDALLALWLVPENLGQALSPGARDWFEALAASGRACRLRWTSARCDGAIRDSVAASARAPGAAGSIERGNGESAFAGSLGLGNNASVSAGSLEPSTVASHSDSRGLGSAGSLAVGVAASASGSLELGSGAHISAGSLEIGVAASASGSLGVGSGARVSAGSRQHGDASHAPDPLDIVHTAWVATERLGAVRAVLGEHVQAVPAIATPSWSVALEREAAIVKIVGSHLDHRGPVTAGALAAELGLPVAEVLSGLLALESDGAILRGNFTSPGRRGGATVKDALAASDALADTEWCNRRVLARIHRLTLAKLRREIEPVSAAALMRFLLRWQRVVRNTQLIGADGLARVIEQLQGFETAAGAWERELLPARLHGYEAGWLDQMCLAGHVVWCRLSPRKAEVIEEPAPKSEDLPEIVSALHQLVAAKPVVEHFAPHMQAAIAAGDVAIDAAFSAGKSKADALAAGADAAVAAALDAGATRKQAAAAAAACVMKHERTPMAVALYASAALEPAEGPARAQRNAPSRSAPLALMLRRDAGWLRAAAAVGQIEAPILGTLATRLRDHLATNGASFLPDLVTAMDVPPDLVEDALWELVGAGLATADGFASLRVLVDRRRGEVKSHFDRTTATAPTVRKWQDAIRRARTRDRGRPAHALRSLPTAAGRWSLLPPAPADAINAEASARQLLHRYGVVFRDLLARESSLPPWRDLLVALRRLEARGEIRGGRFVTGFVGEQFALPEAADELRGVRNPGPNAEVCRISATDPLNLVGVLSAGPRVPAIVGNAVLYMDGQAVASIEGGELVRRAPIPPGARIDDDLTYHPPPRPLAAPPQAALPL